MCACERDKTRCEREELMIYVSTLLLHFTLSFYKEESSIYTTRKSVTSHKMTKHQNKHYLFNDIIIYFDLYLLTFLIDYELHTSSLKTMIRKNEYYNLIFLLRIVNTAFLSQILQMPYFDYINVLSKCCSRKSLCKQVSWIVA